MRGKKEPILTAAGYIYNFDRLAYYNRHARKAFSVEWVEDHDENELRQAIDEPPHDPDKWEVYAVPPPSKRVIEAFLAAIDA